MSKKSKKYKEIQSSVQTPSTFLTPLMVSGRGKCADPSSELTIFWNTKCVRLSFSQASYLRLGSPTYISIQGRQGYSDRRYIVPHNEKDVSKGTYKITHSSKSESHRCDVRITASNRDFILKDWAGDYKIGYDEEVQHFYIGKSKGGN